LASLSLATNIVIINSKPDWQYFIFLFFATFLYYNFHKISWFGHPRMIKIKSIKYQWPAQYPGLLLLSLIIGFTGTMALITEWAISQGSIAMMLEVKTDNLTAISLYESLGYAKLNIRKNYFGNGLDALVMRKEIP
jgi:hypothetical protein